MSLAAVRDFLAERAPDVTIVELPERSTTTTVSAAWDLAPAQIAKTLTLTAGGRRLILVACGDSRLDNRKAQAVFGGKTRMLPPQDAAELTGHPVGGLCPFGLATPLAVYTDVRLREFEEVVLGAGSTHTALRIDPARLADLVGAEWVDVCA